MNYKQTYQMNYDNPIYDEIKSITTEEVIKHSDWIDINDKSSVNKIKKEIMSERLMTRNHIWYTFFGNCRLLAVTDKAEQKSGIDFKLFYKDKTVNVDLKASFGDYRINGENTIAIEWKQNGKLTYTEDKATDYVVYVYGNTNTDEVYFIKIPIDLLINLSKQITSDDCFITDNGSGECFRLTLKDLTDKYNVEVIAKPYSSNVVEEKWLTLFK